MIAQILVLLSAFVLVHTQNCGCGPSDCCSKWGYCGTSPDFCGEGCQSGPCSGGNQGGSNQGNQVNNGGGGHTSTRCGNDWGSANSQCNNDCSNDGPCGGGHCYNSLSMSPCGGGGGNPPPPPPPPNNQGNQGNHGGGSAVATWYCSLDGSKGSCFPGSCGTFGPAIGGYGIAAVNPGTFGTGGACSYQGPTCGRCFALSGPGGTANIQVTDCCAGYPNSPSCLTSPSDPYCDWCAHNDHQHFDLDWDSFARVCAGQTNNGHCSISASEIGCPGAAMADFATTDPTATTTDTTSVTSDAVPTWAIALLTIGSLVLVALIIIVVMLQKTVFGRQQHV